MPPTDPPGTTAADPASVRLSDFAVRVYSAPGVSEACLALQTRLPDQPLTLDDLFSYRGR